MIQFCIIFFSISRIFKHKYGLILQHQHHNLTFMACTTASGFCAAGRYPVTGGGRSPPGIRVDPCGQMDRWTHIRHDQRWLILLSQITRRDPSTGKAISCFSESTQARNGLSHLIITHLCLYPLHGYPSTKSSFSAQGLVSPSIDTALWIPF